MTMRVALATTYLEARVALSLAMRADLPSRIGLDELARLGVEAFGSGADGDALQFAVDTLANRAAQMASATPKERASPSAVDTDLQIDRAALDAGLPAELLRSFRGLAESAARGIVKRAAQATDTRSAQTRADDLPPATYRGTWSDGAAYPRGSMVTHGGVMWHAESESVTGRPGEAPGWRLMHKSMERERVRNR